MSIFTEGEMQALVDHIRSELTDDCHCWFRNVSNPWGLKLDLCFSHFHEEDPDDEEVTTVMFDMTFYNRQIVDRRSGYVFEMRHTNLRKVIDLVPHVLDNYKYSKMHDKLVPKTSETEANFRTASLKLVKRKKTEDFVCCVCLEPNTVFTNCGHCLCRLCDSSMEPKWHLEPQKQFGIKCPMCRELITNLQ